MAADDIRWYVLPFNLLIAFTFLRKAIRLNDAENLAESDTHGGNYKEINDRYSCSHLQPQSLS